MKDKLDALKQNLVGKTEVIAREWCKTNGWTLRVVVRDGESLAVTPDMRSNRVNVVVAKGEITKIYGIQ